jgi:hypothetical protein
MIKRTEAWKTDCSVVLPIFPQTKVRYISEGATYIQLRNICHKHDGENQQSRNQGTESIFILPYQLRNIFIEFREFDRIKILYSIRVPCITTLKHTGAMHGSLRTHFKFSFRSEARKDCPWLEEDVPIFGFSQFVLVLPNRHFPLWPKPSQQSQPRVLIERHRNDYTYCCLFT